MLILELSVLAIYITRKLLQRHTDQLQSVVVAGAGICIDAEADLNMALTELYQEPKEIAAQIKNLEILVRSYHQLEGSGQEAQSQRRSLEKEILWVLGLKLKPQVEMIRHDANSKHKVIKINPADRATTAIAIVQAQIIKSRFVPLVTQSDWIEALCPSDSDLRQSKYRWNDPSVVSCN